MGCFHADRRLCAVLLGLLIHGVLLPKLLLLLGVVQIVSAIILAKGAYRRHADTRQTEDSSDQKE